MSFVTSLRCRRKKVQDQTNTPTKDNSYNGYQSVDLGLPDKDQSIENPVNNPEDND